MTQEDFLKLNQLFWRMRVQPNEDVSFIILSIDFNFNISYHNDIIPCEMEKT